LVWEDLHSWSPVVQKTSYTLTGALIVETGTKLKGRKVTLTGGDNYGWSPRSVIEDLYTKAATAGLVMTLTYKGTVLSVMFDHEAGAVNVGQAMGYSNPESTDWIRVNSLNFITV
jgi:hypothetical protein